MKRTFEITASVKFFNGRIRVSTLTVELDGNIEGAKKIAMQAVVGAIKEDAEDLWLEGHWSENIESISLSVRQSD